MVLTVSFVLSPVTGFVVTVVSRYRRVGPDRADIAFRET
jgi:hypothetical protein